MIISYILLYMYDFITHSFVISPALMRRNTGGLENEAVTSNPIFFETIA